MAKRRNQKASEETQAAPAAVEESAQEETQAEAVVEEQQQEAAVQDEEKSSLEKTLLDALKPYRHQAGTPDYASTVRIVVNNLAGPSNVTISKDGKIEVVTESGQRIVL